MNDLYDIYDAQLRKISRFRPHSYQVVRYTVGHQQLVVSIEPETGEPNEHQRLFIVFEGVEYMQIYPFWRDALFKLMSSTERDSLLEKAGIDATGSDRSPLVFCAFPLEKQIVIVCWRMWIADRVPKFYNFFS